MGKKLAIKGHLTRGKEIIELLEMLGGNTFNSLMENAHPNRVYYIGNNNAITWTNIYSDNGCLETDDFFTLEEFLEKYPYKVGDKVVYEDDNDIVVISEIKWDNTIGDIFYSVKKTDEEDCFLCPPELLKPYKKTNMNMNENKVESTGFMQMGKTCGIIFNEANYEDEVELQLGNYEIIVRDGKTYAALKKLKYPKTYKECCDILKIPNDKRYIDIDVLLDYNKLLSVFTELLICRKAYYKIAGEEMGLDKPWEPDWYSLDRKYNIYNYRGNIKYDYFTVVDRCLLVFPTEEMRDVFYENFKDLIERCKELL